MTLTLHWPGITPWNVWDLTYPQWQAYASQVDQIVADNKKR